MGTRQLGRPWALQAALPPPAFIPAMIPDAPIQPSQPGALGPEQGSYIRLPGFNYMPAGGIPIDELGDANIAAGTAGLLITIAVAPTYRFRAEGIGFGADDETATAFINWTIVIDSIPVSGYNNKAAAIGTIAELTPIGIMVPGGSTLTLTATVSVQAGLLAVGVPVTYRTVGRLRGWLFAEREG